MLVEFDTLLGIFEKLIINFSKKIGTQLSIVNE